MPPTHRIDLTPTPGDPGEVDRLIRTEWTLTNATGAYAMGTAAGAPTRRYHGLLVAAARPPVARIVALSQLWERIALPNGDKEIGLNTLLFDGGEEDERVLAPRGVDTLISFEKGTFARWTHRVEHIDIIKTLRLHWKQQAATVTYEIKPAPSPSRRKSLQGAADTPIRLLLSPMLPLRDFHAMRHEGNAGWFDIDDRGDGTLTVRRDGQAVTLLCTGGDGIIRYQNRPHWWGNVSYPRDAYRGQESWEDLFVPGTFEISLDAFRGGIITLTAALGEQAAEAVSPLGEGEDPRGEHLAPVRGAVRERLATLADPLREAGIASDDDDIARLADTLALAADDFVVDRTVGDRTLSTILAGYPWFADWGRDTFIALPGLLLSTGRYTEAREVLAAFADALGTGEHEGLVPNRFDDYGGDPHYNTVDASLWYIHAALEYIDISEDTRAWDDFLKDACTRILDAYAHGTGGPLHEDDPEGPRLIRMDEDGLITAGHEGTQLTWMDAACHAPGIDGEWRYTVFTSRAGKCVEINALWYSALMGVSQHLTPTLSESASEASGPPADRRAAHYRDLADRCQHSFIEQFWDSKRGFLADRIRPDGTPDPTLRPNQAFALSLPRSPLPREHFKPCLDAMRTHLLTPAGPRTLSPGDPEYHPRYGGSADRRDGSYHQGTAWPWLIGGYCEGILRAAEGSDEHTLADARREALSALAPLLRSLLATAPLDDRDLHSLGQLYEIHDATPPHTGRGCPAQAWSVAEPLRVLLLLAGPGETG